MGGSARGARSSPASGVEEVISSNVSEGGDLPENEQEDKEDLAMDQEVVEEKQDEEEVILPNLSRQGLRSLAVFVGWVVVSRYFPTLTWDN